MDKPYIVCHMMTSIDGRIDCAMTAKLKGVDEYYAALEELNADATLSGRVTAQEELTKAGFFQCKNPHAVKEEKVAKYTTADKFSVVVDTKGTLGWDDNVVDGRDLIVITSEKASKEYLEYLDAKKISYIACGKDRIDLTRACAILADIFGVKRMAIVGGGHINAGFLAQGLIDEVSLLMAPGIDGRGGMAAVFDGLKQDREPVALTLHGVKQFANGSLWIRYGIGA